MLGSFLRQLLRPRAARPAPSPPQELISAIALQQAGEHARAAALCRIVLEHTPDDGNALHLLGSNLLALEEYGEAARVLERVTAIDPASGEAHYSLGLAKKAQGDLPGALASFRAAMEASPHRAEACVAAGTMLLEQSRLDEAQELFREAIARRPRFAEAHYSLGVVLASLQRFPEAIEYHHSALEIDPRFGLARANLLFLLNAHSPLPQTIYDEHRAWAEKHGAPDSPPQPHSNDPDPERRLRVGYVSPDLWEHPVGRFLEPLLEHHDAKQFEVICYHSHSTMDAVSERLRARADGWVECADLSDYALAARIRDDGIDILVDLAAHTAHNRTLAFALRPAPVQAIYLGYPTTTGLHSIDYRITDWTVDPPGSEAFNVEQPARLPHSYFCYVEKKAPPLAALPASQHGSFTFGSFNACVKWSDATLALWARVLNAVPGARLFLKAKDLSRPGIGERVLDRFADLGVASDRIELQGWEPSTVDHFSAYNRVDIALDTYPYNGATTTCEALWMGVPVVTLKGATHASRMAASILAAAGLRELITESEDAYVETCTRLAGDLEKLAALRAGLRGRLRESPLTDAPGFTRELELEYRKMWRAWCGRPLGAQ